MYCSEWLEIPGARRNPPKNTSDLSTFHGKNSGPTSRISGPRHIIEAECFDGHVWTPTGSSGGGAVMVARLRQRALVTGPMGEDRGLTCAINCDDWDASLR